jgi:hypothetical protein
VQEAARGRGVAPRAARVGGADALHHLMHGVGIGEDVVRGLPVRVLVGGAEVHHAKRCGIAEGAAEVAGCRARARRCLERINDRHRVVAEQRAGERRMIRPALCAAPVCE